MIVLPLVYLFWWKKRWRLLLGVIILAVLAIGYLVPGEFAFSKLTSEIEKNQSPKKQLEENKSLAKKLEEVLKSISDDEPKPSDDEKTKCEKSIIRLNKEIKKFEGKKSRGEELSKEEVTKFNKSKLYDQLFRMEWIKRWGEKEKSPTFLFCGEQFNEGLSREGGYGNWKLKKVENHNIIDFGQSENNNPKKLTKKLEEICEQNELHIIINGESPVVWLKNIDKIANREVKKKLIKIVDPDQKNNLGKYYKEEKENGETKKKEKIIDFSQFTLVATTSTVRPKLPNELRAKLKHIEPFLEKYKWVIFFSSIGVEIIVFVLLIRSWRKSKDKSLKHLE
jgi:hypothetical protein